MDLLRRRSKKRDAILDAISSTKSHPSADWVYNNLKDEYPDLSLGTVYRNFALFRDAGQIRAVAVVNGTERYDATTEPHPHFVCRQCGAVIDLPLPYDVNDETSLAALGFSVELTDITYYGLCPCCSDNENKN